MRAFKNTYQCRRLRRSELKLRLSLECSNRICTDRLMIQLLITVWFIKARKTLVVEGGKEVKALATQKEIDNLDHVVAQK